MSLHARRRGSRRAPGRAARAASPRPATRLAEAAGLLAAVWTALALGAVLAPATGRDVALLLSFGLASLCCGIDRLAQPAGQHRPPASRSARRRRLARGVLRNVALVAAGIAIAPWLVLGAVALGRALGLVPAVAPPAPPSAVEAAASLALAPAFEEHLYRGRLLPALCPRLGRAGALLATSLLFALPHLDAWPILGAALTGLLLGIWMLHTGRVADCVALHVGMNLWGLGAWAPGGCAVGGWSAGGWGLGGWGLGGWGVR